MKVAVLGSRNCENLSVDDIIRNIPQGTTLIVSGGAKGVDALARQAALRLGIPLRETKPEYEKYGKSAPLVRNESIVAQVDLVLVFWDFRSAGTADVIAKCIHTQTPVRIFGLDGNSQL